MAHSTLRFGETFDTVLCPGSGEGAVSMVNLRPIPTVTSLNSITEVLALCRGAIAVFATVSLRSAKWRA